MDAEICLFWVHDRKRECDSTGVVTNRVSIGFEHEDLAIAVTDNYDGYVCSRVWFISRCEEHFLVLFVGFRGRRCRKLKLKLNYGISNNLHHIDFRFIPTGTQHCQSRSSSRQERGNFSIHSSIYISNKDGTRKRTHRHPKRVLMYIHLLQSSYLIVVSRTQIRSGQAEYGLHKLIITYLNPSIAVGIKLLERLGELLDDDASPYETIKRDSWNWSTRHLCGGSFDV